MSQSGYKVSDLVKAAGVSRQAYYKWLTHEPTVHDIQDQEILKLVKQLEAQHKHCVGYDKMTRLIKQERLSYTVNKKLVMRIMKEHSIKADYRQPKRKRVQEQET